MLFWISGFLIGIVAGALLMYLIYPYMENNIKRR